MYYILVVFLVTPLSILVYVVNVPVEADINQPFREGNKVAHKMTKESLKHARQHQLIGKPPAYVLNNLVADKDGYVYFVKYNCVVVCCKLASTGNTNILRACSILNDVTDNIPNF